MKKARFLLHSSAKFSTVSELSEKAFCGYFCAQSTRLYAAQLITRVGLYAEKTGEIFSLSVISKNSFFGSFASVFSDLKDLMNSFASCPDEPAGKNFKFSSAKCQKSYCASLKKG